MKEVYQTIIDRHKGNCMQAAVASLLELDLNEVPNFIESDHFECAINKFLNAKGYQAGLRFQNPLRGYIENPTYCCFHRPKTWLEDSLSCLKQENGVKGYFIGAVYSSKFDYKDWTAHFPSKSYTFDIQFGAAAINNGYKIGIARGIYVFHLYRWGHEHPEEYLEHLL